MTSPNQTANQTTPQTNATPDFTGYTPVSRAAYNKLKEALNGPTTEDIIIDAVSELATNWHLDRDSNSEANIEDAVYLRDTDLLVLHRHVEGTSRPNRDKVELIQGACLLRAREASTFPLSNTFRCRPEWPGDLPTFAHAMGLQGHQFDVTEVLVDENLPCEITFTFRTDVTLDQCRAATCTKADLHVIRQTIATVETYTGERDRDVPDAYVEDAYVRVPLCMFEEAEQALVGPATEDEVITALASLSSYRHDDSTDADAVRLPKEALFDMHHLTARVTGSGDEEAIAIGHELVRFVRCNLAPAPLPSA